ncbi:MAG: 50S ribosomal protein L11 [Candidatus ainarchaeum sp.]|nr:50S ribosomal protein L11 [Candidatus ainarchaeum sp.]
MGEIKVMVDAGKANAGPPLGPSLAPTGVNIGLVVAKINEATTSFSGMKIPVTIIINSDKTFDIKVGLPPVSALIKKEAHAAKGAGNPKTDVVGNLTIEQVLKLAKQKYDSLNSTNMRNAAKEIMGSCDSMGIHVEGLRAKDAIAELNAGKFDEKLK